MRGGPTAVTENDLVVSRYGAYVKDKRRKRSFRLLLKFRMQSFSETCLSPTVQHL